MNRRDTLWGLSCFALAGVANAATRTPATEPASTDSPRPSGMRHRSYSGRILYLTDGIGEQGRELFSVTVQPDGSRTLRAQVEMDNDRLLRDVMLTVDQRFHPIDAFVRLVINEQFVGSTWYSFTEHTAECEGVTALEGRFSQRFESAERINLFTAHPINCDAWLWGAVRKNKDFNPYPWFNSSPLPNGGSGPTLIPMQPGRAVITHVGSEAVTVAAGTFQTQHFQLGSRNGSSPPLNTWVAGEDCLPIRLRSEGLRQTYDLVEVHGDPR